MVQIGIIIPLMIGGIGGALWREYRRKQALANEFEAVNDNLLLITQVEETSSNSKNKSAQQQSKSVKVFDDVEELNHYKNVSWYALALTASGAWFYAPATLVGLPLVAYNSYHFFRVLRHSDGKSQKSALTLFEGIGIGGTLLTGRFFLTSIVLLSAFISRYFLIQAGNISHNVGLNQAIRPNSAHIWVLRDGVEIELNIADVEEDDIIVMRAGETAMLESRIVEGQGVVKQFSLEKKIKYITKQSGDKMFPFTRLESGELQLKLV